MFFTKNEVMEYVESEDVKFIRLAFCDVFGKQKNISIMPTELERAFETGISFDASAIKGFCSIDKSDLFLFPDPSTLTVLPWRPSHGRVVRLFCDIRYPDGRAFENDGRHILRQAVREARELRILCNFGAEFEFYLFLMDENGVSTNVPHDYASYMDIAPEDKGENVRREICLTLEQMGVMPESSHHEEGPGQHEVDFKYSDAMTAADNATTFKSVVRTIAARNGLYASFDPKPLKGKSGNGLHINMSPERADGCDLKQAYMAGVMKHIAEITAFLNPREDSYDRLGEAKAPRYITWSPQNRSQLIRVPAASDSYSRIELRSPDCNANPYLAYALLIYAGLEGIVEQMNADEPMNVDLYSISEQEKEKLGKLPSTIEEALKLMCESEFVKKHIPETIIQAYCNRIDK